MWTAVLIVVAFLFVLLNGFFVLVEFALVKIRRTRLEEMVTERPAWAPARTALKMHQKMDQYLSATQLGITVASLGLGWIGEPAFAHIFESVFGMSSAISPQVSRPAAMATAFCLITFLHILLGELAPKSIAIQRADAAILWVAPIMQVFYWIFLIPLTILTYASNLVLRLIGVPPATETETAVSEEELRLVLAHSHRRGELSLDRLLLFENALDLTGLTVGEIMVPISRVDTLDTAKAWKENLETVRKKRRSRYPISEGGKERITGMVHVKDMGIKAMEQVSPIDLQELRRDVLTVRDTVTVERLIREFQKRHQHLAIVKDAAGRTIGIVTLEDLLEQLVGEIVDEFEVGMDSPLSLAEFVTTERVLLDIEVESARDAIERMLQSLKGVSEVDPSEAFDAVWRRERDAPTGIGRGIAIPHGRIPSLKKPCVVFARCPRGVDFKSSDGVPARLLFLILTPSSSPLYQVKLLGRIAGMMQSSYLASRLEDARTPEEIMQVIRAADVAITP